MPELFARRLHGRELFGHSLDGHSILRDAERAGSGPELILRIDDPAATPDFDVDSILDAVAEATSADPDETWEVTVVRGDRRRLLAAVPAPPLGASVVRAVEATERRAARRRRGRVPAIASWSASARSRTGSSGSRSPMTARWRSTAAAFTSRASAGSSTAATSATRTTTGRRRRTGLVDRPRVVVTAATAPGPIRGAIEIVSRYDWPVGLAADGTRRSEVTAPVEVTTAVELRAGEPFVRLAVSFTNPARDHRVRWHLPLPRPTDHSAAEGQFAVVERGLTEEAGHGEVPTPTFPAHGWVHAAGATVLLDHVTEYELVDGRELALTVLRSTGLISRNDNPFREDPAGPEIPVPAAQMVGPWRFAFALLPHAGSWEEADVLTAAEAYHLPFVVAAGHGGSMPPAGGDDAPRASGSQLRIDWSRRRPQRPAPARRRGWRPASCSRRRRPSRPLSEVRSTARGGSICSDGSANDLPLGKDGALRLALEPWEIATVQLHIVEQPDAGSPEPLGSSVGPRRSVRRRQSHQRKAGLRS